ncbi:MAG: hypothetical protein IPP72_17695 [Chitinophagaceae bacterium]|nr:hypothetical protein [Chitinophagaceae bacterium]
MKHINIVKYVAVTVCSIALLAACKKDEADKTPEKIKKMLYNWKITGISVPKANQPEIDSSLFKPCMNDDIIKFNTAGFDFQDGTTRCDSSIFYYIKGSWSFDLARDSVKLNATNPAKYVSWKVVTLNDSVLKVKFVDSLNPARKLNKSISFKH